MRLEEFRKHIQRAEESLGYEGVCVALNSRFSPTRMEEDFKEYFHPRKTKKGRENYKHYYYWLGKLCFKNRSLRKVALRLFEQVAISEKLYKRY